MAVRLESPTKINFPVIFRMIGWLVTIEAIFMIAPVVTSYIFGEEDFKGNLISMGITLVAGLNMATVIRPKRNYMGKREAILLTVLVWIVFTIFGMLPYMLGGIHMGLIDAFFEATSGFTTTGASTIINLDAAPHGIIIWRSVMQWIGGMGIILFTLAVLPMLNHQGGIQLFNAEVSGLTHDKLRPRISQTAKALWYVYLSLTLIEGVLLLLGPMPTFDAVCYTLSTVSTGGFPTKGEYVSEWNSIYVESVLIIFMFLGSINFQLIYRAAHGNVRALFKNDTFRWYVSLILVMFTLFEVILLLDGVYTSTHDQIMYPLFQIVATMSSAGFVITDHTAWGPFAMLMFLIMMFFGACAGSTSSGAKLDRLVLFMKSTRNEFYRILHPNSIQSVRLNGRVVPMENVSKVVAFISIYVVSIMACTAMLCLCDIPVIRALYSSVSCISNIGYGDWTQVNDAVKVVLSFAMIMGRLELFTFLVIFTKDFWVK